MQYLLGFCIYKYLIFKQLIDSEAFARQLAQIVRTHRKHSKLTQAQLAIYADVGKTVIYDIEQIALPLNGKKNNLTRKDFINYFAIEKLTLPHKIIEQELAVFKSNYQNFLSLIDNSFLDVKHKENYRSLFIQRYKILSN